MKKLENVIHRWAMSGYPMSDFEKLTIKLSTGEAYLKLKEVKRIYLNDYHRLLQLLADRGVQYQSRGGWVIYKNA